MADEVLQMEARLKNLISGELNKIKVDLNKMEGSAKKSFKESSKGASQFMGTLKGFIGAQALIGGAKTAWRLLSNTVSESIKLYGIQEKAEARLRQSLGHTSDALLDQASALQKVTLFGDEETLRAQARIADFIKEEGTIKKLTPAIQDMAAAKEMDLAAAADLVTKSIASSTNALSRYGIDIQGAAGSTERAESAIRALEGAFGGAAEAVAKDGVGPMIQFQNTIGDVKEQLGEALIPGLNAVIAGLQEHFVPVLEKGIQALSDFLNPKSAALEADIEGVKNQILQLTQAIEYMNETGSEEAILSSLGGGTEIVTLKNAQAQVDILTEKLKDLRGETNSSDGKQVSPIPGLDTEAKDNAKKEQEQYLNELAAFQNSFFDEQTSEIIAKTNERFLLIQEEETSARQRLIDAEITQKYEGDELDMERLKLKHDRELEEIQISEQAKSDLIKAQSIERANFETELEEKKNDQLTSARQDAAMAFIGLTKNVMKAIGKENKEAAIAAKGIAIAEATINTFLAASKANSATPYPPVNAALMAVAIAQGLAQVALISAQSFQSGGIVAGSSFSGDNIPARVNSGEMVLTREQQSNLFNQINSPGVTNSSSMVVNINGPVNEATLPDLRSELRRFGEKFEQASREGLIDFNTISGIR